MTIIIYQIETRDDGAKSIEPLTVFKKLSEAKSYITQMLAKGKEVYGMKVGPMRVNRI